MRVINVLPKFSEAAWGGAETTVLELSRRLRTEGFLPEVWTCRLDGDDRVAEIDGLPIRRYDALYLTATEKAMVGIGKAGIPPRLLVDCAALTSPSIVHAHCHNRLSSAVIAAARRRHLPSVLTIHSSFRPLSPRWRYWWSTEAGVRWADAVFAPDAAAPEVRRVAGSPERVHVLRHGVDRVFFERGDPQRARATLQATPDARILLMVGRICELKNQLLAVEAMEFIAEKVPEAMLVIVGPVSESQYGRRVRELIASSRVGHRVRLLDPVPRSDLALADLYAVSEIVLVPSRSEALPLVVLEAWASGTPLIAAKVEGLDGMITDGVDGRLFEPVTNQTLAAEVVRLMVDTTSRSSFARAGKLRSAGLDWPNVARSVADVYSRLARR